MDHPQANEIYSTSPNNDFDKSNEILVILKLCLENA